MLIGITKTNTYHGERLLLPAATRIELKPADNLPDESKIKYWAHPLPDHQWSVELTLWAESVGVGLYEEEVIIPSNQ